MDVLLHIKTQYFLQIVLFLYTSMHNYITCIIYNFQRVATTTSLLWLAPSHKTLRFELNIQALSCIKWHFCATQIKFKISDSFWGVRTSQTADPLL